MLDVLADVVKNNTLTYSPREGDYKKDGLLYCGKCHEARQYRVAPPIPGVPAYTVFVDCRCDRMKKEKEEQERKENLLRWEIKENKQRCFQNSSQRTCTFANDDGKYPELTKLAKGYCNKFKEIRHRDSMRGLLLYGTPGGGKSYAACAICNELLEQGYSCRIATIPELTNELQNRYDKNEYLDYLCDIDLLVLDDFGVQRNTSTANEQLFEIINHILLARLPVIVTTNMSGAELKNPTDTSLQRVTSRLFELCFPFEVKYTDRRKTALKDNYEDFIKLLDSE